MCRGYGISELKFHCHTTLFFTQSEKKSRNNYLHKDGPFILGIMIFKSFNFKKFEIHVFLLFPVSIIESKFIFL